MPISSFSGERKACEGGGGLRWEREKEIKRYHIIKRSDGIFIGKYTDMYMWQRKVQLHEEFKEQCSSIKVTHSFKCKFHIIN